MFGCILKNSWMNFFPYRATNASRCPVEKWDEEDWRFFLSRRRPHNLLPRSSSSTCPYVSSSHPTKSNIKTRRIKRAQRCWTIFDTANRSKYFSSHKKFLDLTRSIRMKRINTRTINNECKLTWALACSPTKITSLVASWSGISDMKSPLPVSPSRPFKNGELTNKMESDSGQWTIWPLSSKPLMKNHNWTHFSIQQTRDVLKVSFCYWLSRNKSMKTNEKKWECSQCKNTNYFDEKHVFGNSLRGKNNKQNLVPPSPPYASDFFWQWNGPCTLEQKIGDRSIFMLICQLGRAWSKEEKMEEKIGQNKIVSFCSVADLNLPIPPCPRRKISFFFPSILAMCLSTQWFTTSAIFSSRNSSETHIYVLALFIRHTCFLYKFIGRFRYSAIYVWCIFSMVR